MSPTAIPYSKVQTSVQESDLSAVAQYMYSLMLRNIATASYIFIEPNPLERGKYSTQGCIIASPSYPAYPANPSTVDQDYVYNWTRDAAIAAFELAFAVAPSQQMLIDYVNFASICQNSGASSIGYACYTIGGQPRTIPQWSTQSDGPALQTLAILQCWSQIDSPTQATARTVIGNNLTYLLAQYQNPTTNLWEEFSGNSFFARAVQLRCFQAVSANTVGISVPAAVPAAIAWLQTALQTHWNGAYYVSLMPQPVLAQPNLSYDPNIDIIMACIYGAAACTDTQLLATAARVRSQWTDQSTSTYYPINVADAGQGLGPLMGRYPGDTYDGDVQEDKTNPVQGHPWPVCTCSFAELYYRLANAIGSSKSVPLDDKSSPFFAQIGVSAATTWGQAVAALQSAADNMLGAVIVHSDHLELSEQFDRATGYEKSVADLTWSYAAFLSVVRAKTGTAVTG